MTPEKFYLELQFFLLSSLLMSVVCWGPQRPWAPIAWFTAGVEAEGVEINW